MQFNVTLTSKGKCHSPPFILALFSFIFACASQHADITQNRLVNLVQRTFSSHYFIVLPWFCFCSVICIIREQITAIGSKVTRVLALMDLRPCLSPQSSCGFSKPGQGTVSQDFFLQFHQLTDIPDSCRSPRYLLLKSLSFCLYLLNFIPIYQ